MERHFLFLFSPPANWEIYNLEINARVAGSGDSVEDGSRGWKVEGRREGGSGGGVS